MKSIDYYIFKVEIVIRSIAATGLGLDAIINAPNRNYEITVIEGLISLYLGYSAYLKNKKIEFYYVKAPKLIDERKKIDKDAKKIRKNLNEKFNNLFKIIDEKTEKFKTINEKINNLKN